MDIHECMWGFCQVFVGWRVPRYRRDALAPVLRSQAGSGI